MKFTIEFEGISEEERVNAGKTCEELQVSGFMLLPHNAVWVPMQLWQYCIDSKYRCTFKYD